MRTFRVELGPRSYPVHVGTGLIDRIGALARDAGLKPGRAALVADNNVATLYAGRVAASLNASGFESTLSEIAAGEASKTLDTVAAIYDRMVAAGMDRQSVVVAL